MSKRKAKILSELGFTYAGLSGKTSKDFGRGKPFIPFMNIMTNAKINTKYLTYVDVASNENQNAVKKGDLFFTTSSETPDEVGMTSVLLDDIDECYLNSFCFGFRLYNFDDLLPDFAAYLFRGNEVRKQIINLGQGYTRFNLPKTELLKKLRLELPSVPEQQKISDILSTADSVIEKTQAAIAKYKAIKQGMLQDLFTRGIDITTNKLRLRYEDAPHLYKESKLGMIPREWEEMSLEESTDYIDYRGKTPPKSDFGVFLVTAKNIRFGYIDYEISKEYIRVDSFESAMSRGKVKLGDVLFTTEAPLGNVAQINREDVALAQRVIKYRGYEGLLNNDYLALCLMSDRFQRQLFSEATGTTVLGIKGSRLHKLKVSIPKIDEQTEIVKKLKSIDNKLQTEQTYLQKLKLLKIGLMEDLLSGKIKVKSEKLEGSQKLKVISEQ